MLLLASLYETFEGFDWYYLLVTYYASLAVTGLIAIHRRPEFELLTSVVFGVKDSVERRKWRHDVLTTVSPLLTFKSQVTQNSFK